MPSNLEAKFVNGVMSALGSWHYLLVCGVALTMKEVLK